MLLWSVAIEMLCVIGVVGLTLARHLDSLRFGGIMYPLCIVAPEY